MWRWRKRRKDGDDDAYIGRYDEDRVGMYESDLFRGGNDNDGSSGSNSSIDSRPRTVHMGMDLLAPAGAPVHAVYSGTVHAVGYNPRHGDYGHVIVVRHAIGNTTATAVLYALYGHLDGVVGRRYRVGDLVRRGQVLGYVGAVHENGGWNKPHVHFQLATQPPDTHDMLGAVHVDDREAALRLYPDPRYVLGALY
jgi:peptidoglycan LD-endopeptidase LytH